MTTCPACGSNRVFRSKSRGYLERVRRQFTMKRPYRCHACNWRGWAAESVHVAPAETVLDTASPPPDLGAIDTALEDGGKKGEQ